MGSREVFCLKKRIKSNRPHKSEFARRRVITINVETRTVSLPVLELNALSNKVQKFLEGL